MMAYGQGGARKVSVRSRRRQQEKERLANRPFAVSPPPQLRRGPSVGWFGQLSTNCGMACGLLLFAVFLGCLPSVGGTATVPFSRTVVRGRHILTRKEYLHNFAGDTAGWAQYMEDQYFAEQGVSLTADAEERARDNPRETLGQAKSRLFDARVRKPNNRPSELSQAANQSRVRRRQETYMHDPAMTNTTALTSYLSKFVLKATEHSGRFVLKRQRSHKAVLMAEVR